MFCYLDCAEDGKETTNSDAPENNPQYTTVYVGNLASEASGHVSSLFCSFEPLDLHAYIAHPDSLILVLPWLWKFYKYTLGDNIELDFSTNVFAFLEWLHILPMSSSLTGTASPYKC